MTRELVSVLDLKQAEPFNAQQAQPINDWVMQARNITQWTPEGLALLRRIVRDRRLKSPSFFDQIFERHADVTAALLPDVLDMTQQDGAGSQLTPARQAVYTFPRLDPALLKPHAGQIIGLLARDKNTREALLPVVGRLGVDPLPYLLPFEDDWKSSAFAARVRGACYAEPQWAPELIAALRRFADAAAQQGPKELQKIMPALQALAHLGDGDYVDQYLAKADEQRFRRRIHNELADKRRPDTLCWFY
jgi:hypothetical protein